jgi:glycine cleavage system transcriptional repressor
MSALPGEGTAALPPHMEKSVKNSQLVISAIGQDRPGIVDRITRYIFEHDLNISDSRMSVLGGEFAIQMLVVGPWNEIAKFESTIPELESSLDLSIVARRTDIRPRNQQLLPYIVDVVALDNPGIVHHLANFFSQRNINIEELTTTSYAAPHTGTPMFAVNLEVGVPADIQISELRDDFMQFCDTMNLDAVLEPAKN